MMVHLRGLLLLTLVYLALTSNLQGRNIIMGLVVASLILALIRPHEQKLRLREWPGATVALARFVLHTIYDLTVSGWQMARIVLDPRLPIQEGIVRLPTDGASEAATALSAQVITLTPGELVVEMDEDAMYVHVLGVSQARERVARDQQRRRAMLEKIFPDDGEFGGRQ